MGLKLVIDRLEGRPRLDTDGLVGHVHLQHLAHGMGGQEDTATDGQRPAQHSRHAPYWGDGNAVGEGDPDNLDHVLGSPGEHDHVGHHLLPWPHGRKIRGIGEPVEVGIEHPVRSQDLLELIDVGHRTTRAPLIG